jgi:hypothetical protein
MFAISMQYVPEFVPVLNVSAKISSGRLDRPCAQIKISPVHAKGEKNCWLPSNNIKMLVVALQS